MAIKEIKTYEMVSNYWPEGVEFIESPTGWMLLREAVMFAITKNWPLQSLREAVAFRLEAGGNYDADAYNLTRTVAIYFVRNGSVYVAFDDSPSLEKNIVASYADEGYARNYYQEELMISMNDRQLIDVLRSAEKSDRIQLLPFENLELVVRSVSEQTRYGTDSIVKSLIGDLAEPYAKFLRDKNIRRGCVWLLDHNYVKKTAGEAFAIVRPVALGGGYFFIAADSRFNTGGVLKFVRNPSSKMQCSEEEVFLVTGKKPQIL